MKLVSAAEHIVAQFGAGRGLGVVHAHDKQGTVNHVEAAVIVGIAQERVSMRAPDLAVLSAEHAYGAVRHLVRSGLVCVAQNGLKVAEHGPLGEKRAVLGIERLEPVIRGSISSQLVVINI